MAKKKEVIIYSCDVCDREGEKLKLKMIREDEEFHGYTACDICYICVGELNYEAGIHHTSKEIQVEQGSLEWHQLRQGRVTGTKLGSAIGTPAVQKTLKRNLIAERMTDAKFTTFVSEAMQRGIDLEDKAVDASSAYMGRTFRPAGFLLSSNYPMFGFSPDGVHDHKEGHIVGGVETKCPNSETHLEYILDKVVPKKYDSQVLTPFVLDDRIKWWLFTSFDDRVYSRPTFFKLVRRVDKLEEIAVAREKLEIFLADVKAEHLRLSF